jgi:hypothetical protein
MNAGIAQWQRRHVESVASAGSSPAIRITWKGQPTGDGTRLLTERAAQAAL